MGAATVASATALQRAATTVAALTEVKDVGAAVRNGRAGPVQAGAVLPALQVAVAVLGTVEGRLGAVGVAARSNGLASDEPVSLL